VIHKNKDEFVKTLEWAIKKKPFLVPLLEKDYYLTLILSRVHELSEDLVFKGGTCLSKAYYAYYRLSEDLDFSMKLPRYEATRGERRKSIQPIKDRISKFAEQFDMKVADSGNPGRNESKQYVYHFSYQSALRPIEGQIKLEIGLRFNPIDQVKKRQIHHAYTHPFTGESLFDGGKVACLSLNEIVSEKLRAAALRKTIAPRDFYDLDFIIRNNFNLADREVVELFKKKIDEDSGDTNLAKYRVNMGHQNAEIEDMRSRIKTELFDVLSPGERENFDLDKALERINKTMEDIK